MKLPFVEFGEPNGVPIILIAGLFGQGKNLAGIARVLANKHHVFAVDLRNHGSAPWDDVHDYPSLAGDIIETFEHFPMISLLGHSMGGKTAMMVALTKPDWIKRLLIADIAPVQYSHSHSDDIDDMLGLDLRKITNRREADAALAQGIPDANVRAFLLHGLKFDGSPHWVNNLRALKNAMPNIVGWPDVKGSFDGATLFVGGTNSTYITHEHRDAINTAFPNAKITHIKNAGHWLHVEQASIFATIVNDFFGA